MAAGTIGHLRAALGPFDDPELVSALFMAYSGAMMLVGTGNRDFLEVIPRMRALARLIDPTSSAGHRLIRSLGGESNS